LIPKVLHQFWVGPPMPAAYRRFGGDWRRLHPEWDHLDAPLFYHHWNDRRTLKGWAL